jgi:HAD superfamily hydrolase (TIGR01457 family)
MDGVIYRGKKLLPGAKEIITSLRQRGDEVSFLSNNSTLSRSGYQEKLTRMGIKVERGELFPSSYLAALYFSQDKERKKSKVFVIGEVGLLEELKDAGIQITSLLEESDFVLVGMDRNFTYAKLNLAYQAILRGAIFLATNMDLTYPVETGTVPAAGSIIKAIEASTGKSPLVLGKPNPFGIETVVKERGSSPARSILIGDRLETDILAGKKAGVTTVLVLSGITGKDELKKAHPFLKPDYTISSLPDVLTLPLGKRQVLCQ